PYAERGVPGPPGGVAGGRLSFGYHRLVVEVGAGVAASLVVSAPRRAGARPGSERASGVFLPLYALHSRRSWGVGDLTDLGALREWARSLGATVVATLPLLAAFLDEPFEPSPYSPASRLFWNELFIDVTRIPELERSPEGRALVESSAMQRELASIRTSPLVDYRRTMAAKRKVLEELARCFYAAPSPRTRALEEFTRDNPRLEDYAGFRSAVERHHAPWTEWPQRERDGALPRRSEERRVGNEGRSRST